MSSQPLILALDQGTTSTRAVLFNLTGTVVASAQKELRQIYPRPGWVEHDPELIWSDTLEVCRSAINAAGIEPSGIAAMGITNQRETVVVWERATGKPIHNAIVWQDRRTAGLCSEVVGAGREPDIQARTGLVVDAYFSASKLRWLLENVPGARASASRGELLAGTVDSFILWRLTGGAIHATDATNAGRTMLFNIHTQQWDDELLGIWDVPRSILPEVLDSNARFGSTETSLFGASFPVTGIAGDQHAAMVGQVCIDPGMAKCTYGTGAFLLLNTGDTPVSSSNRLLGTLAYRVDGSPTYAFEGSIFSAGSAIQWLRDGIGVIPDAAASQDLARRLPNNGGVFIVPAFTGLGAPYWDPDARGAVLGVTRDTSPAHFARAALEAVGYQTLDLLRAMAADGAQEPVELRVDGGMAVNDWLCQFIADIAGCVVQRPENIETTVLGAALLAATGAGLLDNLSSTAQTWRADRQFQPTMSSDERDKLYAGWQDAVRRVRSTQQG